MPYQASSGAGLQSRNARVLCAAFTVQMHAGGDQAPVSCTLLALCIIDTNVKQYW